MHESCQENWGSLLWARRLTIASLWLVEIAMDHTDLVPRRSKALLQTHGDRDRSMLPTGAADANVQITAAFTLEEGNQELKQTIQFPDKCNRVGIAEHIIAYSWVLPRQRLQIWHEEGIAKEANIEKKVNIIRYTKLETEREQGNRQRSWGRILSNLSCQELTQVVHRQV